MININNYNSSKSFVRDGETGLRLLTTKECKAIMGFPSDFIIPVSRTQMYRQMGNYVAIPVVKTIAENIIGFRDFHQRGSENVIF